MLPVRLQPRIVVFGGHFGHAWRKRHQGSDPAEDEELPCAPFLPASHVVVFVREPVARIISQWEHCRRTLSKPAQSWARAVITCPRVELGKLTLVMLVVCGFLDACRLWVGFTRKLRSGSGKKCVAGPSGFRVQSLGFRVLNIAQRVWQEMRRRATSCWALCTSFAPPCGYGAWCPLLPPAQPPPDGIRGPAHKPQPAKPLLEGVSR